MTIPDLVELKYGRTVRHLASALIVWYMIMLAASQMVALGRFLEGFLGWPYLGCLALGTAVVLAYSVAGGLRSVVFTDIVQFALLVAGHRRACGLSGRRELPRSRREGDCRLGPGWISVAFRGFRLERADDAVIHPRLDHFAHRFPAHPGRPR